MPTAVASARSRGQRPRSARNHSAHSSAYSLKWMPLRSATSHHARCSTSLGMAEKAKISAISATGGTPKGQ